MHYFFFFFLLILCHPHFLPGPLLNNLHGGMPLLAYMFCSLLCPFCFMYGHCPSLNNVKAQRRKLCKEYCVCQFLDLKKKKKKRCQTLAEQDTFGGQAACILYKPLFMLASVHGCVSLLCTDCEPCWKLSVASLLVLALTRGLCGGVKGLLSSMSFKQPFLSLLASHSFSHPKEINQSLGKCCRRGDFNEHDSALNLISWQMKSNCHVLCMYVCM